MKRAAIFVVFAATISGCNPFESKLYGVCEDALKERLRSPSTYERVRLTARDEQISAEAYEIGSGHPLTDTERTVIQQGAVPHRHVVIIEYDAANAYGTPVRGAAECIHYSLTGDSRNASRYSISLN